MVYRQNATGQKATGQKATKNASPGQKVTRTIGQRGGFSLDKSFKSSVMWPTYMLLETVGSGLEWCTTGVGNPQNFLIHDRHGVSRHVFLAQPNSQDWHYHETKARS